MQRAHVGLLSFGGMLAILGVMAGLNVPTAHSADSPSASDTPATVLLGYDPVASNLPDRVVLCEKNKSSPARRPALNAILGRLPI